MLSGASDAHGAIISNPNVYYEYGLMTAWDKNIIPVQKEDQNLAFNIQSLDTVKYLPSNFKTKLSHSVRLALTSTEISEENEKANRQEDLLSVYFELKGLPPLKKSWMSGGTHFHSFQYYNFGRIIYSSSEIDRAIIETKIIARRLEGYAADLDRKIIGIKKSIEKANTTAQTEHANKQLDRIEKQKERVLSPKITIVLLDHEFKNELDQRLDISEIIPNSAIKIISYDEMSKEIEEM